MPQLQRSTFAITQKQIQWLKNQCEKTGLLQAEIVRRALDAYAEAEEAKEQRQFFSNQQRKDIKTIAQAKGIPELTVIRRAIDRELNRFFQRF